jgi:hypothetical protein
MTAGFYGSCGSGKTFTMKRLVGTACAKGRGPFVVLDLNDEWAGDSGLDPAVRAAAGGYRWCRVPDASHAAAAVADGFALVLVQPGATALDLPPDAPHELRMRPLAPLADELAGVAIKHPGPAVLVLPEAHMSAREGYPLPPNLRTIAHRWRHKPVNAGCWWDTQHFADVSKDLERCAAHLYFFGNASAVDLRRIRDLAGDACAAAVLECGKRAAAGEPGYHVRVGTLDRSGPFPLRRL